MVARSNTSKETKTWDKGVAARDAVTTTGSMTGLWAQTGVAMAKDKTDTAGANACAQKDFFMMNNKTTKPSPPSPTVHGRHGGALWAHRHLVGRYPGWQKPPLSPSQALVQGAQWLC
jgi:hypothetical protein